jgi:hypothetical protein
MILQEDVKPTIEFIKDLARYSGKIVMRIRAEGPLKCQDQEKVKKIWQYYEDKVPYEILDELISYGDIYCYFRTKNDAQVSASNWFPSIALLQDPKYTDIDMDYYISMECVDPEGLPVIGI